MIRVGNAGKKGRGIFATTNIPEGSIIEQSPYIHIPSKDFEYLQETIIERYWFYVSGRNDKATCAIGLGYTSLYNHSKKPNADWIILPKSKTIKVMALRDIRKNQEITINYGYEVK